MKPIIGVTPDFNAGDREDMGGREPTYFLRARYVRAIEDLGGVPLILRYAEGLLIPEGSKESHRREILLAFAAGF